MTGEGALFTKSKLVLIPKRCYDSSDTKNIVERKLSRFLDVVTDGLA